MRHSIPTLAVLAAALAASVAGCDAKPAAGAIPRETFVRANIELRSVPDTAARGDSLRKAVLRRHRVSEAQLRRFVDVHGRSPEYLARVWREVADSLQKQFERHHPPVVDQRPPPPEGIPGAETHPIDVPGARLPQNLPPMVRPPGARKPPPPPDQPPPPVTERPRPMVRNGPPAPTRKPPVGLPPDARGPTTVPGARPVPIDTLERRRR